MTIYREAQRKEIELNLNLLVVFRAAQSANDSYRSAIEEMKRRMNSLVSGETESVRQNWAELKKRGR
jgi:hypothetical protein